MAVILECNLDGNIMVDGTELRTDRLPVFRGRVLGDDVTGRDQPKLAYQELG
jgi:hypothetical protein